MNDFCIADQHDEKRDDEEAAEGEKVIKELMPPPWKTAVCYIERNLQSNKESSAKMDHPKDV